MKPHIISLLGILILSSVSGNAQTARETERLQQIQNRLNQIQATTGPLYNELGRLIGLEELARSERDAAYEQAKAYALKADSMSPNDPLYNAVVSNFNAANNRCQLAENRRNDLAIKVNSTGRRYTSLVEELKALVNEGKALLNN